ncbi:hypothetical protein D3C72_547880 [compost metagenome]
MHIRLMNVTGVNPSVQTSFPNRKDLLPIIGVELECFNPRCVRLVAPRNLKQGLPLIEGDVLTVHFSQQQLLNERMPGYLGRHAVNLGHQGIKPSARLNGGLLNMLLGIVLQ